MLLPALFEERWEVGKSRMLRAEQEKRPGRKRLRAGQRTKLLASYPGYKTALYCTDSKVSWQPLKSWAQERPPVWLRQEETMKTHGLRSHPWEDCGLIQPRGWPLDGGACPPWWWGATNQILGHTLEVGLSRSADEWMCSVTERQVWKTAQSFRPRQLEGLNCPLETWKLREWIKIRIMFPEDFLNLVKYFNMHNLIWSSQKHLFAR